VNTRFATFAAAALALVATGLSFAPSEGSRTDLPSSPAAHRFVPTTAEIDSRDEEAAPTF
jgi:hypothetical protein